jgi:hypothetical protein
VCVGPALVVRKRAEGIEKCGSCVGGKEGNVICIQ